MKPETVERRTENVRNKTESNDHVNNCESNVGVDKRSLESKAFVYSLLFSVRNDYLRKFGHVVVDIGLRIPNSR